MGPSRSAVDQDRPGIADAGQVQDAGLARLVDEWTARRDAQRRAVDQAVAELADVVRTGAVSRELRAVLRRVDLGELTWREVVLGERPLGTGDAELAAVRELWTAPLSPLPELVARAGDRGPTQAGPP